MAAGAGGHAGPQSPPWIQKSGLVLTARLLLSERHRDRARGMLAAQVMGADLAYVGSPFTATDRGERPA